MQSDQTTTISGDISGGGNGGGVSPPVPLLPPIPYRSGASLAAKKPTESRAPPEADKRMRMFQQRLERQLKEHSTTSTSGGQQHNGSGYQSGSQTARAIVPLPPDMLAEAAAASRAARLSGPRGHGNSDPYTNTREPSYASSDAEQSSVPPPHSNNNFQRVENRVNSLPWSDGVGGASSTVLTVLRSPRGANAVHQQQQPSPKGSSVGSMHNGDAPLAVAPPLPLSSTASAAESVPTDDLIAWLAAGGETSLSAHDLLLAAGEGGKKVNRHALVKKLDAMADDAIHRKQALGAASGGQVVKQQQQQQAKSKSTANNKGASAGLSSSIISDGMGVSRTDDGMYILSQHVTGYSKEQHIKYVESFVARNCAESRGFDARADAHCKSLDAVCDLNPSLVNIYSTVKHFVKEVAQTVAAERKKHADQLIFIKKATHAQQQKFYEDKFVKALAEKSEWQRRCTILTQELMEIKKARDEDLMTVKEAVLQAAEKVHEDDQEVTSMRSLVTTVFQVNRENELRVAQLQEVIIANRLALPLKLQFDNDEDPTTARLKAKIEARRARIGTNTAAAAHHAGVVGGGGGQLATAGGSAVSLHRDVLGSHMLRQNKTSRAVSPVGTEDGKLKATSSTVSPMVRDISPPMERESVDDDAEVAGGMRSQFVQPKLRDQVSIEFLQATKHEMELCRLSTQRVLVNCAQESQSTYKLLVSSLTAENKKLKSELESVREAKDSLERFVHEKRFLDVARQQTQRDDAELAQEPGETAEEKRRAILNRDGSPAKRSLVPSLPTLNIKAIPRSAAPEDFPREQLTPRPMFPFEIQPSLGVDLRQSTSRITEELSTVAINLKRQLDEMHVRVRRLASSVTWMDEYTANHIAQHHDDAHMLPVAPTAVWDCCHHFLRTTVQPSVLNLKYSQHFTAFLVAKFLDTYQTTRETARWARDAKMLAPRTLQPFERRYHSLVPLDASVEEVTASVDHVPIGYVVTQFVITELFAGEALRNSVSNDLMQSRHSSGKVSHRFLDAPVELEVAKVAYNFWYAARKYRDAEPLCGFFVEMMEGRLPYQAYEHMVQAQHRVLQRLQRMDPAKNGSLTYNQISTAVQSLFSEFSTDVSRGAVFAVAQTLESKHISAVGSISIAELTSDEKRTLPPQKKPPTNSAIAALDVGQLLLANAAMGSIPTAPNNPNHIFAGSSLLMRFLRRIVVLRCDAVYRHIEAQAYGCIRESGAVAGMFLLQLSKLNQILSGNTSSGDIDAAAAGSTMVFTPIGGGMTASFGATIPPPLGSPADRALGMSSSLAGGLTSPLDKRMSPTTTLQHPSSDASPGTFRTPIATLQQQQQPPNAATAFSDVAGSSAVTVHGRLMSPLPRAGGAHDVSEDVPPFLHVGAVPTCLGNVVTCRQSLLTAPTTDFVEIVGRITATIPKYNTAIHFPPSNSNDDSRRGSTGGKGKGQKKSGKGGGLSKSSKATQQQTMELVASNDTDWVEWYTFLYAMRTTAPTDILRDSLFTTVGSAAASPPPSSGTTLHPPQRNVGNKADAQAPRPE